jgi:hypothetical protein
MQGNDMLAAGLTDAEAAAELARNYDSMSKLKDERIARLEQMLAEAHAALEHHSGTGGSVVDYSENRRLAAELARRDEVSRAGRTCAASMLSELPRRDARERDICNINNRNNNNHRIAMLYNNDHWNFGKPFRRSPTRGAKGEQVDVGGHSSLSPQQGCDA